MSDMAKDRIAVTCNGRTAFYACMYEDIRQCAMDCGWAVSLHGSLASDMDIMAMPWVENAVSFKEMVDRVSKLFKDNDMSSQYVITYNEKSHNRVGATIPIWSDFYLDISTIDAADVAPKSEVARCKDCVYFQPDFVLTNDGERRPYTEEEKNSPLGMVTGDVGVNCGSRCERFDYWADNRFPVWFQENDYCSYFKKKYTGEVDGDG